MSTLPIHSPVFPLSLVVGVLRYAAKCAQKKTPAGAGASCCSGQVLAGLKLCSAKNGDSYLTSVAGMLYSLFGLMERNPVALAIVIERDA